MATLATDIGGLQAGQKAWRLDDGTVVITEVVRLPDEHTKPEYFFRVRAWTHAFGVDNLPLPLAEIPEKRHSVVKCALAHGAVDLAALLAGMEADAVERMRTWLAAADVLASVPVLQ